MVPPVDPFEKSCKVFVFFAPVFVEATPVDERVDEYYAAKTSVDGSPTPHADRIRTAMELFDEEFEANNKANQRWPFKLPSHVNCEDETEES